MTTALVPRVAADDVSKTFYIPREHVHTLKEKALHPFRRPGNEEFRALKDVSFQVEDGEFFGIAGRNGSGKSTLLKCLAGIYKVDDGQIYVNGRVSTFIELGVGFNPDLAAYDNVMLNATMLGLSQRDAKARFERIIDFAELHEFTDLKLKNYSSGMLVRLAFSVMIQVDADILFVDEVLAVGDAAFQQKCFDEFQRIRESGTTVLLVTHDMSAVRRFCDRAMLLEHGKVVMIGDPDEVGHRYNRLNFSPEERAREAAREAAEEAGEVPIEVTVAKSKYPSNPDEERWGDGTGEVVDIWIEDSEGVRQDTLAGEERCVIAMKIRFEQEEQDPLFSVTVHNDQKVKVLAIGNGLREKSGVFTPGDESVVRFAFDGMLAPGRYFLSAGLSHSGTGGDVMDVRSRARTFVISSTEGTDAIVQPQFDLTIARESGVTEEYA